MNQVIGGKHQQGGFWPMAALQIKRSAGNGGGGITAKGLKDVVQLAIFRLLYFLVDIFCGEEKFLIGNGQDLLDTLES
ncbi:hypothetical protein D3C80_1261200 [compost metagenome]